MRGIRPSTLWHLLYATLVGGQRGGVGRGIMQTHDSPPHIQIIKYNKSMFKERVKALQKTLANIQVDALLVSNHYNILYLTGFKGLAPTEREGWVLVTGQHVYLFTDGRYVTEELISRMGQNDCDVKLIGPGKSLLTYLSELTRQEQVHILGFEADSLLFQEYQTLRDRLQISSFVPTDRVLLKQRAVKDQAEISTIRSACQFGDACLKELVPLIKPGMPEKELAFKMELITRQKGYELAFDTIVAVGANSAIAHYNTKEGNGVIESGSVVLVDYGLKYKNYVSDITRMFFMGQPSDRIKRMYEVLLEAQEQAIEDLKNEEFLKDVDANCRDYLQDHNLPNFAHSTGHGVGLEIHEEPKVSLYSTDTRQVNTVVTIEPGVYLPEEFGMRIEDTVCVNEKGVEILTGFPKALTVI